MDSKEENNSATFQSKSIAGYLLAAVVCWGVSFYIAGILLSLAGLIFSIIALRKTLKVNPEVSGQDRNVSRLKILSIGLVIMCGITFVLTLISLVILFPVILEAAQTGDFASLGIEMDTGANPKPSIW